MRLAFKAVVGLTLMMLVAPARLAGAPARVRLMRSAKGGVLFQEVVARMAGEVVAAGFSVALQDISPEAPVDGPETAVASIAITSPSGGVDDAFIEVWVGRDSVYRTAVTRDPSSATDDERALTAAAVHAVAVLQTALLARARGPRPSPVVLASAPPPAVPSVPPPPRFNVALGLSSLESLQGLGAMLAPTARIGYRLTPTVMVGLRITALGTSVNATALAGTARIRQDLVVAEARLALRPAARVHPIGVGAVGVYHMGLAGSGTAPFGDRSDALWGGAVAGGVGISVDLSKRMALSLEGHALWVFPQPNVQIDTANVGRTGRPALSQSLEFRLWL